MATLSSHILDSIVGGHANGIKVELYRLNEVSGKEQLFEAIADKDGRISETVDIQAEHSNSEYELVFHSADYFAAQPIPPDSNQIMTVVVVRLSMPDPDQRYHIPLVLSPHSYTIWWSG